MTWLFFAISVAHAIVFTSFFYKWKRLRFYHPHDFKSKVKISIVIPIRNEEKTIENLLNSLNTQKGATNHFEVIIVNDHSEDRGVELIENIMGNLSFPIALYHLPKEQQGKKAAVTLGVSKAKNDLILCTDSDCIPEQGWVATIASFYCENDMKMVSGPVKMHADNFLGRLQQIEFSGLIGFGAISLSNDHPGMCNGANMAFSRKVFLEVRGYEGNEHIASGDDEFLLQKIAGKYPEKVGFVKSQQALVNTPAKGSLRSLVQQRMRWAGKWRFHKSLFIKSSAIFSYLDFLSGVLIFLWAFFEPFLIFALIIRFIGESIYLRSTLRFSNQKISWAHLFLLGIIYPFFVVILGIASIFGKYSWKGRNY